MSSFCIDLDGVVADFHGALIHRLNDEYKTNLKLSNFTTFDYRKCLGDDVARFADEIMHSPNFFQNLKPYPGAVETCSLLDEMGHKLYICTAPPRFEDNSINADTARQKIVWVQKHMPFIADRIIISRHKELFNVDYLIDDALHNVSAFCKTNENSKAFLIDRPWNGAKYLSKRATRTNLTDIPELVGELV